LAEVDLSLDCPHLNELFLSAPFPTIEGDGLGLQSICARSLSSGRKR
jgi:hypothetical protein